MAASSGFQTRIGKYELGKTIGQGNFAKVRRAKNVETGEIVAIKVLDKEEVMKHKMVEQLKREISTMKLVKHPNIVQLHEVLASKSKVYIVLEYVTGGELFNKIVHQVRFKEKDARKYFQQLINAVDYCHSRGVYHRDLKPENLLLDKNGNLKISDFGLSALPQHLRSDGLFHTTCGTPNYVAPEVINNKGYDGAIADLWSCGVILYVLLAGFLPFDEKNLMNLYKKIFRADFKYPKWFSSEAKDLISKILQPNPKSRITIPEILENEWFKVDYKPAKFLEEDAAHLKDVEDVFNEEHLVKEEKQELKREDSKPVLMNAFELLSMSSGLDLSGLFEKQKEPVKRESRFASVCPANQIISKIEETARPLGFDVRKQDYKMKLVGSKAGRKGQVAVATEVFEVAPSLFMVEMRKAGGDTLEYTAFRKDLYVGLKDIVWKNELEV